MAIKHADLELDVEVAPEQCAGLAPEPESHASRLSTHETMPNLASKEYRLLYLPTMLGVYTARHQQMPTSNASLREHVFGSNRHAGCVACREETEFLVVHQKKFF